MIQGGWLLSREKARSVPKCVQIAAAIGGCFFTDLLLGRLRVLHALFPSRLRSLLFFTERGSRGGRRIGRERRVTNASDVDGGQEVAPRSDEQQAQTGGDQCRAGKPSQRKQKQAEHAVEEQDVSPPDEVGMREAKRHQPEQAPVVDIGRLCRRAALLEPRRQHQHPGAEEHGEDRAHLAFEEHGIDRPDPSIRAGNAAGHGGIEAGGERQRESEDIHQEDAEDGDATEHIHRTDALLGEDGPRNGHHRQGVSNCLHLHSPPVAKIGPRSTYVVGGPAQVTNLPPPNKSMNASASGSAPSPQATRRNISLVPEICRPMSKTRQKCRNA